MSAKYKLTILPEAQNDIREIISYIAGELAAPQAALDLQDVFERKINTLSFKPQRIKTVNEQPWKKLGVRKLRVKNYYVYFIISEETRTVKIMAVIYIGRDQKEQLEQKQLDKQ